VRESAHLQGPLRGDEMGVGAGILGDGLGDGVVEAPVERAEFVSRDRHVELDGQFRHCLTDIPVPMDNLAHGEACAPLITTVSRRAPPDLGIGRPRGRFLLPPEHVDELVQEEGNALLQFLFGGHR
jgi:hypothetical protein